MRVPPISNVTTYEYDSLNKQKSVKFFCENKEVKTSYSSISRKGFTPTGYKVDTIVNEKAHLRFVEYTTVDTSFNDIYKTNSRIDSVLYTGAIRVQYGFMGYQHSKTYFNYYPNGSIKEMNFISYDDLILTIKQSFKYYQNGLLEEVITENRYNGLRKEISGFKYQYF